jgi:hypothetical protein
MVFSGIGRRRGGNREQGHLINHKLLKPYIAGDAALKLLWAAGKVHTS